MKATEYIFLGVVIFAAALLANLIALKIAGDQVSGSLEGSTVGSLAKLLGGK